MNTLGLRIWTYSFGKLPAPKCNIRFLLFTKLIETLQKSSLNVAEGMANTH